MRGIFRTRHIMALSFRCILTLIVICCVCPMAAQEMSVDNFCRMKKKFLKAKTFTTDKAQAILDMKTSEKGFTFKADGKNDISAKEGDGVITLTVPHKTRFIQITHKDYGTIEWKVPEKYKVLKKRKHYCCELVTKSPKKAYHMDKQWAVFYVQPENAILYVDSVMHTVRKGMLQLYLPLGKHKYKVEAPFYESREDSICLNDSERVNQQVALQPIYSYLTINTPLEGCTILLDGDSIGNTSIVSNRLIAGRYRITVVRKSLCYYNDWVDLQPTEKKVVNITEQQLKPTSIPHNLTVAQLAELPPTDRPFIADDSIQATVHIIAPDSTTTILINREKVGEGKWDGTLKKGFYAISTLKDGMESAIQRLWIDSSFEKTINLSTPQSAYGMLNVQSNVVDADIFINGIPSGKTPSVVRNLPADRICEVVLKKKGYKDAVKTLTIRGNEMNNITINMK